jgi:hypothetical protein
VAVPKKKNKKKMYKYFFLKKKMKKIIAGLINDYKKIKKKLRLKYERIVYW